MAIISTSGACSACGERLGFRCEYFPDTYVLDESTPMRCRNEACRAPFATAYVPQNRRASMSSRHVKDFYAEGHEVFQVGARKKGDNVVYSRGDEQRLLEKHGLSPEDGLTPLKDEEGYDIF